MLKFIDENKARWGVDYLVRPDGPPFITLDITDKLKSLGLKDKGFRELTLRLAVPVLIANGVMRIALTGFDKSTHAELLPDILERLDMIMSLTPNNPLVEEFKKLTPSMSSSLNDSQSCLIALLRATFKPRSVCFVRR